MSLLGSQHHVLQVGRLSGRQCFNVSNVFEKSQTFGLFIQNSQNLNYCGLANFIIVMELVFYHFRFGVQEFQNLHLFSNRYCVNKSFRFRQCPI